MDGVVISAAEFQTRKNRPWPRYPQFYMEDEKVTIYQPYDWDPTIPQGVVLEVLYRVTE